ncbi:MAG: MFS transporter, partial [archaeon]|nr:MFS transporter [archaeon]
MNQIKNGNKNKNIELYKLGFAFFLIQFQFWFPIWVIFLLDRGISFLEVIIADVVYNSAVIFFEFPLGMLGDRLGRKKSYSLGAIIWAITFITMILTHNFYILLLCWIFWAMALAMISGTDKAYIYEMIVQTGNLDKSSYIFGYFTSIQNLAFLISHFLAGYLYEINSNLPIFLNAILYLIAVLIILTIPRIQNQKSTVKTEIQPSLKQAITTTKKILNKKIIRNIVIVMGVLLMYF